MSTKVILCCGAGFSSGFLAQRSRQAIKIKNFDMTIEAKSESVISEYMDEMDILLVGPHYASALEQLKSKCEPRGIKVALIPTDIYATIDGERLVEFANNIAKGKE